MQPEPWVTAHSFTLSGLWGNCLPLSCRYRQQAFPESSLVKALELELQLQRGILDHLVKTTGRWSSET